MTRVRSPVDRLWARVDMGAPDECWEWRGTRSKKGYGRIQVGTLARSMVVLVHRLAWEATHGPIVDALCVLHRCDNPPCCNPAHLFLGTRADNNADKLAKGRQPRGETHQTAVLSDGTCREIQHLALDGWVQQDIANAYGVSQQHVSLLKLAFRRRDVLSPA